jgi:hypothetical protein
MDLFITMSVGVIRITPYFLAQPQSASGVVANAYSFHIRRSSELIFTTGPETFRTLQSAA